MNIILHRPHNIRAPPGPELTQNIESDAGLFGPLLRQQVLQVQRGPAGDLGSRVTFLWLQLVPGLDRAGSSFSHSALQDSAPSEPGQPDQLCRVYIRYLAGERGLLPQCQVVTTTNHRG